jgi:hypothetical protein
MYSMKKFMLILAVVAMLLIVPLAFAEAVDAVPAEGASPDLTQLLTKEVLATMAGMVLLTAILTQGIKMLFMRNSEVTAIRTMAFIVAAVVTVVAKLIFSLPFEVADILILPGNALLVWWASMKGYEQILGSPTTPAGNAENKNIH